MKVAIIGAGLAGLSLARQLQGRAEVTLFEKSRGVAGRMATRYAGAYEFDHGAQYFTVSSAAFEAFLAPHIASGLVQPWQPKLELVGGATSSDKVKYVASPRMNDLCKALAEGLTVEKGVRVFDLYRADNQWRLESETREAEGAFDWVISAAPAPQTAALMPPDFAGQTALSRTQMSGCFSLMLGFETALDLPFDFMKLAGSPIGVISVNSNKPGRPAGTSLLIQSTNDWAEAHMEDDLEDTQAALLKEASALTGIELGRAAHQTIHRWRYAAVKVPAGQDFLIDETRQLAACGDWCLGSKVEAAFLSGSALGTALLERL